MTKVDPAPEKKGSGFIDRALGVVEKLGNKLPDPAMLFLSALLIVWVLSWLLSGFSFSAIDPRSDPVEPAPIVVYSLLTGESFYSTDRRPEPGETTPLVVLMLPSGACIPMIETRTEPVEPAPIVVKNLLTGDSLVDFLAGMVDVFMGFAPLGVVLLAMLGVGTADKSGFINTGLKLMLAKTSKFLLTPVVILVGIISHSAVDAGYVLVIPLGAVIFYAAGRHPLAGIVAAFAGVSGGFSANPIPSALDPLLQSFTQKGAQILDPEVMVNPLCNYYFTAVSSMLIVLLGWFITDRIIEPRLRRSTPVDNDAEKSPDMASIEPRERKGFWIAAAVMAGGILVLVLLLLPSGSPFRDEEGKLSSFHAPIMESIVPLIFLLFLIPGVVYGFVAGSFKTSKDVVNAMTKSMEGLAYYIVMAFFCALFVDAFGKSNIGALLAIQGAELLKMLGMPGQVTIIGIIFLTAFVNLFVGSASAKWALLAPIFVPMLMGVNLSPELTQAAYRIGDSSSNIITPLMPYFPLVVVFCQRYVKKTGIGTLVSLMLPFALVFITVWTAFLIGYWLLDIPLGMQAGYVYP